MYRTTSLDYEFLKISDEDPVQTKATFVQKILRR